MPDASPPDALPPDALPPDAPSALLDPWSRKLSGPIPLNRFFERHGAPPFLMAVLALIAGFVLFQGIGTVMIAVLLAVQQVSMEELAGSFEQVMAAHVPEIILSNSVGQVLGLAVPAVLLAWAHTSRAGAFLRVRKANPALLGLAVGGLVLLLPCVYWLGALNEMIPLPDWLQMLEQQRMELIEGVIRSDLGLLFSLLTLAVTPALCEELLFRGYVQRQFERGVGAAWGIGLTGLTFGLFHLSAAQVLPLTVLGLYLAYLTWRTGSLWTAIAVHFANNAISVVGVSLYGGAAETSVAALETMQVPWYIVTAGLAGFALVVYALQRLAPAFVRGGVGERERGGEGAQAE